jgi:streptogrisin D
MNAIRDTVGGRRRLATRLLAVLAAAVVAGVAAPGAASAGPAAGNQKPAPTAADRISPEIRARMVAQEPLKKAASRIQWSVVKGSDKGYAGIVLGAGEVVLWWKGPLPRPVADTVADVRRTTPVRVAAAAHSRAELEAAAKGVEKYMRANPHSPYHGVDIAYDGSGLTVHTDPSRAVAAKLPAAMAVPAGVPVAVAKQERPQLTGRLDDYQPYWGGGRIQNNDNGAFCTAGFPVTMGGGQFMLTAGHCGRPYGTWNNGNDTRFFGTAAYEHQPHDLLLIATGVAGRMWDGGVGWNEFTKGVAGWDWVYAGELLCTSGSVTGAQCNDWVGFTFTYAFCDFDAYGNYECFNDLTLAYQLDGLPASRPGDSGGPVFGLWGAYQVLAKGTITGRFGSNGLIFQDFGTAWWDFGIVPMLG